jgi:DNA polymerase-3 subunit delta
MKSILEDIRKKDFRRVYLLYGEETYLRGQYCRKLLEALGAEEGSMNFSRFQGKGIGEGEIIDLAETMPFFAEKRVILLEDTGFFKNKAELLADYLGSLPEYLVMIFVEDEADRRSRMYKGVQKNGRAVEFSAQNQETLTRWVLGILGREGKKITRQDMERFLEKTGTDMGLIRQELEKLLAYTLGREIITDRDIEAVCTSRADNRIFEMVRAVSERKQKKALEDYYDLLALKEPPMRILYLLARQFNLLFQVKELREAGCDQKTIASRTGLAPFAVKNYLPLTGKYSSEELKRAVEEFTETETAVKTGRLSDVLSVELMIVKYSSGDFGESAEKRERRAGQNQKNLRD